MDDYGIASLIFHMMFLTMCAFVMLNLVIAVILENFQKSTENEEATVSRDHFLRFQEVRRRAAPQRRAWNRHSTDETPRPLYLLPFRHSSLFRWDSGRPI